MTPQLTNTIIKIILAIVGLAIAVVLAVLGWKRWGPKKPK